MSDAAEISGLYASHTITVQNTGTNPALNTSVGILLNVATTVSSMSGTAGTCTNPIPRTVSCDIGTLAAGATYTLQIVVHLPPYSDYQDDIAQVTATNIPTMVSALAREYFVGRYWTCFCGTTWYANGWQVPGISAVTSNLARSRSDLDDTVHLPDGYVSSPDGVLHFPDGREIIVDSAAATTPSCPPEER